jgi:hypothetical protein
MQIDLVYFEGCPHVEAARVNLRRALAGTALDWREWNLDAPETPERFRGLPSPTVLVAGEIVGGAVEGSGRACRVGGAPTIALIAGALERHTDAPGSPG